MLLLKEENKRERWYYTGYHHKLCRLNQIHIYTKWQEGPKHFKVTNTFTHLSFKYLMSFLSFLCVFFFFLKLVSISRRCRPSELYIAVWLQVKKKKKGIRTWINPTAGSKPKMLWIMNCRQHFFYRCELLNWPAKWKLRQRTGWKDCRHVMSLEKKYIYCQLYVFGLFNYVHCMFF